MEKISRRRFNFSGIPQESAGGKCLSFRFCPERAAAGGSFDAGGRRRLALTYARLAGLLARQGATVIVATISLFHELHAWNRDHLPGYVEIFLDVPEAVRRRRDPKGLYAAHAPDMAGAEVLAELPLAPHLRLDGSQSREESLDLILKVMGEGRGRA